MQSIDPFERSCCFTGHRRPRKHSMASLIAPLEDAIRTAVVEEGVEIFYSGGAQGFDLVAAQMVLNLRKDAYPHIQLILALPCRNHDAGWRREMREVFDEIAAWADEVHYVSEAYTRTCMMERNRYMVDRCRYMIAYCEDVHARSGTAYTVNYATKCRRSICMLQVD